VWTRVEILRFQFDFAINFFNFCFLPKIKAASYLMLSLSLCSFHTFFSPGLNQKGKISKTLFSLVDLSDIPSYSHSLLSLVNHSPPPARQQATIRGDQLAQRNTYRDREREQIRSTHSSRSPISVDHRYSLSLSLLC
jgi:hypothetical protein